MDKIKLHSILWWIKQFTFSLDGADAPTADPAIGAAALKNAQLGTDAFNFYKQEYEAAKPANQAQHDLTMKVQQQLLDSSTQNAAYAKEYQDYWKGTFQPLEKNIVADAQNYDSAGRREQEAAKGVSDVRQAFDTQKAITARNNERMGVNPNSGNAAAMNQQNDVSEAVASAGAANAGRTKAELTGHAMEMDAASLGRNLPSNQATSTQIANSAGTSAVGLGSTDLANGRASLATMGAGYNAAMNGNTSQANILNQQYQNQLAGYNTQQNANSAMWGGIGNLAGAAIALYKDGGEVDASKVGLSTMDDEAAEGNVIDNETGEVFSGSGGVRGAGTATSDSIPAKLSDGEFVLNEGAVKMIGLDALDAINKRGLKFRSEGVRNGN